MDGRLYEAILRGDVPAFLNFIKEDKDIIKRTTFRTLNSVLHIAAKFGHLELASEIIRLLPEMASAENEKKETPLHEACREGHLDVMVLLLETDPGVACKRNYYNESVLLVACARGQLLVVKHLLNNSGLQLLEDESSTTSLHVASSLGHLDIVKELLKARPELVRKQDFRGCSPLHLACGKGYSEIARELLRLDPELSSIQDKDGRTPLHWAAIHGRVHILEEILSTNLESIKKVTAQGETVLHLAVKNNQYDMIKHLNETFDLRSIINSLDKDGNTILHLATARKLTTMVTYLVTMTSIDVNVLNHERFTALDVVESSGNNTGSLQQQHKSIFTEAGGTRCNQVSSGAPNTHLEINSDSVSENRSKTQQDIENNLGTSRSGRSQRRQERQLKLHIESLRNARNTNVILAVLIATVTFAAGINPPGGVHQDGHLIGKSTMGGSTSFKVFMVCNNVALLSSLGIVIVLVSVITFRQKPLKKLLAVTHKVMWVSVSSMITAYIAATWVIMPPGKGTRWVLVALLSTVGGCLVSIFVGLGVMLARHLLRKRDREWERKITRKPTTSIDSDYALSCKQGIYPLMR